MNTGFIVSLSILSGAIVMKIYDIIFSNKIKKIKKIGRLRIGIDPETDKTIAKFDFDCGIRDLLKYDGCYLKIEPYKQPDIPEQNSMSSEEYEAVLDKIKQNIEKKYGHFN